MVQYCKNNKKEKISFYFEDYEWTTGMYCSSNDEKLDYIKNVKKLAALENVYIILSLEEVEMLKKYHFFDN